MSKFESPEADKQAGTLIEELFKRYPIAAPRYHTLAKAESKTVGEYFTHYLYNIKTGY